MCIYNITTTITITIPTTNMHINYIITIIS